MARILMSDPIKHECGLAMIRLLHPLDHYRTRYGSALWGLEKMYLLMGKQHNRGQDGAGIASIRLNVPAGRNYHSHERILGPNPPWQNLFAKLYEQLHKLQETHPDILNHTAALQEHFGYSGELLMGHLRYATHGGLDPENLHPVLRSNNWRSRMLTVAGNFNLTNVSELLSKLIELGQHPRQYGDTVLVLERIGHFLDQENQALFDRLHAEGHSNARISDLIAHQLDVTNILRRSAKGWDGGYTMGGLIGHGDMFVARDAHGIRPAFYVQTEDYVAAASERPALATAFNIPTEQVRELPPGHVLVVKRDGRVLVEQFVEEIPEPKKCSFERIYFSRGSDKDIYRERMALGKLVTPSVLEAVDQDLDNTVFSYIPNTAQAAYWGMLKELEDALNLRKAQQIAQLLPTPETLQQVLAQRVRVEQVIHKDTSQRTFITSDQRRDDMAAHVYDITYGTLRPGTDTLVCIDDSIVRGTTLKQSILRILSRLKPKTIVIVSSAPQIRYPDCYGIDMSQIGRFIAFQAAITLLRSTGKANIIEDTIRNIKEAKAAGTMEAENHVKAIYAPFTEQEISDQIARLLWSPELNCEVKIVYQPLSNLPHAIPGHRGDWYFSGNYPTPGGNRVVNQAFLNWHEGSDARAY